MSTPPASRRSSRPATRRRLLGAAVTAVAMAAVACAPDPGPAPNPDPSLRSVSNAVLEWTISREADNASLAPGIVNYWSAGRSDGTAATYVPTNGNVTVQKKNAAGSFVPIGSEPAVSWANKNRDGNGNLVTATNAFFLGQRVRYTGGTGTVNTATGAATIRWSGTFTVNFYGSYTPFWIVDPTLTVDAGGAARLTATIGGRGSSQENPDIQITLPDTPGITLAEFADVYAGGAIATGWTAPTRYLGSNVTPPAGSPAQVGGVHKGAWPQSFVNFHGQTGTAAYWYSSGAAADPLKAQEPVGVHYSLNP